MTSAAVVQRRCHRPGFTLVELLIALVVTVLATAGVAAMLNAVSYGTQSSHDMRTLVVRSTTLDARLSDAISTCKQVEANGTSPTYLLLWTKDANDDDVKDNAEMHLIEYDSTNDKVDSYCDTTATGVFADRTTLQSLVTPKPWCTGVVGVSLDLDVAPPDTKLVSYRVDLQDGDASETLVGAAAVR